MRRRSPWALALWFLSAAQVFAQPPSLLVLTEEARHDGKQSVSDSVDPPRIDIPATADGGAHYRFWVRADYLLYWAKTAPLAVPLVTTGDPRVGVNANMINTVNTAGAIGQPGTRVLLGDDSMRLPALSGLRLTLGGWLDEEQRFGAEGSGFVVERQSAAFSAMSDNAGNPPLYFPIFSALAAAERGIPIADPLRGFSGGVTVVSQVQLWGAELNGLFNCFRARGLDVTLLAGFRYAELRESLQIHNATTDLLFGATTTLDDSFRTGNRFYGGQVGSRLSIPWNRFSLDITGTVALGSTHEFVDIQGNISQSGPNARVAPGGAFPGGLFAQPSNIGQRNSNQFTAPFSALLSGELKWAYEITARMHAFAGYDIMYWNRVARPGNQIDRRVNLSQNAILDPNAVGTLVGPAQPAPLLRQSDFWAQGLNLGLEFRY